MLRRVRQVFNFKKPKSAPYGLSRNFYLSVLTGRANLPSLLSIIQPKGEGGAVSGFGVPLRKDATKDDLERPLERGVYGFSSLDRKTVLKVMVLSKEEAGFDPGPFLASPYGMALTDELRDRIASTWSLIQMTFESYDPTVKPAVEFLLNVADRAALVTDGAVADPVCRRYSLPGQVRTRMDQVVAADVMTVTSVPLGSRLAVHTLGLTKLELPEIEMAEVNPAHLPLAERFLHGLGQSIWNGSVLESGALVGDASAPFRIVPGGADRARWDGIPCFDLLPEASGGVEAALDAWAKSSLS